MLNTAQGQQTFFLLPLFFNSFLLCGSLTVLCYNDTTDTVILIQNNPPFRPFADTNHVFMQQKADERGWGDTENLC